MASKPVSRKSAKPKKPGPPKAKLNLRKVRELAAAYCTVDEIAASLGVVGRTIRRRQNEGAMDAAIAEGKALGRARLRSLLWKMAKAGNVAAAIFLSKQASILGYSDKTEMQHVGQDGGPVTHCITVRFVDAPPQPEATPDVGPGT